jgi:hypothetical protein
VKPDDELVQSSPAVDPRGELEPAKVPVITHGSLAPSLVGSGVLHDPDQKIAGRVIVMDLLISGLPPDTHGPALSAIEGGRAQAVHRNIILGLIQ